MNIADVLRGKAGDVITIGPDADIRSLLALLAEHRVGALVVSTDGKSVEGIVSERDVVRHLNNVGAALLDTTVSQIMTAQVATCAPDATVSDLMRLMTDRRIRHVPVVLDGSLSGIVSIGDVVKQRMEELEAERDHLTAYLHS